MAHKIGKGRPTSDPKSKWITKKKPTNWIVKKQPKTNWITKKEAKEHDTTSARQWITKKTKPIRTPHQGGGRTRLLEELGRVEAEPSNRNRRAEISRVHGELNRGYAKGGRAGYGIGTLVKGAKKIISKIKPKPKPKPTGWSPAGSYTKADDKKINSLLKNLGDEIKAQPLPPKLKETMKKLQKAYPHKKAAGGRIGLAHGTLVARGMKGIMKRWKAQKKKKRLSAEERELRPTGLGAAKGGRIGLRHGGSAGAAIRGRGAEIK